MMVAITLQNQLTARIEQIRQAARLEAVAVSVFDTQTGAEFSCAGDRWFHAASTYKAAILLAFVKAVESGAVRPADHLQIRNRFLSITSGAPYRIERERDGDNSVHAHIGRSLPLLELARLMIVRSSNLATNLLLDFLTLERVRGVLREAGVAGVEVRRGVEDIAAHEAGINNEATADGLCRLFRCFLPEGGVGEGPRALAMEILFAQEFKRMIPARLPKGVRVAHKTGEISTHAHDAGLVFPPARAPYAVAILTQFPPDADRPQRAVADISAAIYEHFVS
ncbi:MAG TPA: serine hydrolase [Chthoniobacteraceae bacterium]|jgi:beta-lactamase class A|nr:serine hydrolase [Chthoniobacteraceae bacterium]